MSYHALLSASAAHRWMNCPPSARLEQEFEDSSSEAAAEGTHAHALAEHKLKETLGLCTRRPIPIYDSGEMEEYTDAYVDFILKQIALAKENCSVPAILVEQRLDFSRYVPEGFGTGDSLIVSDGLLHIVDFKYGQGIIVDADDNPQMRLYALGALELFDGIYDIQEVAMTIFQPRRENIKTSTMSKESLYKWADEVLKPIAKLAFEGKGNYRAGNWCRFCRAAIKCRARAEENLNLARYEFALPPTLTDEDIEEILGKLDGLTSWASDIKAYALSAAINQGKEWNGFKLVEGRSIRKYVDEELVAEKIKQAGYHNIYRKSLIPLTEMERLLGRKKFQETLGSLIEKPPGKPTLVPITDKRPAIQINDFKEDN